MKTNSYQCPTCSKTNGITPGYAVPEGSKGFYCGYCNTKYETKDLKPIHSFDLPELEGKA